MADSSTTPSISPSGLGSGYLYPISDSSQGIPPSFPPEQTLYAGYLRKQSTGFGRDWQRRYFVLTPSYFSYYYHPDDATPRVRLFLISMTLRRASLSSASSSVNPRRFRLLTPSREYCLEAETEDEAAGWIAALEVAIETCHQQTMNLDSPPLFLSPTGDNITTDPTNATLSASLKATINGGKALCKQLLSIPGNEICADCGVPQPTWTSTNLAIFLCIACSGVHRSLGCSISRIRSLEYDSFLPETVAVLSQLGNTIINNIWEIDGDFATRKGQLNQPGIIDDEQRRNYIRDKYLKREFTGDSLTISPITSPRGPAPLFSPEAELLVVVHTNHLDQTARLLFHHGVDVNLLNSQNGRTPLHEAASAGQLLQVHFLLQNGASPLIRDREGKKPAEVAHELDYETVTSHLQYYELIWERGARRAPSEDTAANSSNDATNTIIGRIREGFNSSIR